MMPAAPGPQAIPILLACQYRDESPCAVLCRFRFTEDLASLAGLVLAESPCDRRCRSGAVHLSPVQVVGGEPELPWLARQMPSDGLAAQRLLMMGCHGIALDITVS